MAISASLWIAISITLLASSTAFDSEGVDFWTAFVSNKDGTATQKSLIFFNNYEIESNVIVTFKNRSDQFDPFPPTATLSVTVLPNGRQVSLSLPQYLEFLGGGSTFAPFPPISIHITATIPVRVFGQNVHNDGDSGDLFTILPTSALGTNYVVALNPQTVPHLYGSSVLLIVTQNDTDATISQSLLQAGDVWQMASSGDDTIQTSFSANKPLAVVVGSECYGFDENQCDYRAFMPLPTRCGNNELYSDTHPVLNLLSESNNYILAPECGAGSYQIDGGTGGQLPSPKLDFKFDVGPNTTHVLSSVSPTQPMQVMRTNPSFYGSVLVPVLSTTQYVTSELVQFFVPPLPNNFLQIVADASAQSTAAIDGVQQADLNWLPVPVVNGQTFFIATVNISSDSHTFNATGTFSLTVFGYGTNNYSSQFNHDISFNISVTNYSSFNFLNTNTVGGYSCFFVITANYNSFNINTIDSYSCFHFSAADYNRFNINAVSSYSCFHFSAADYNSFNINTISYYSFVSTSTDSYCNVSDIFGLQATTTTTLTATSASATSISTPPSTSTAAATAGPPLSSASTPPSPSSAATSAAATAPVASSAAISITPAATAANSAAPTVSSTPNAAISTAASMTSTTSMTQSASSAATSSSSTTQAPSSAAISTTSTVQSVSSAATSSTSTTQAPSSAAISTTSPSQSVSSAATSSTSTTQAPSSAAISTISTAPSTLSASTTIASSSSPAVTSSTSISPSTASAVSTTASMQSSTTSSSIPTNSSVDSEGTEFWTAFIANKDGTGQKSLIVVNNRNVTANIAVTYKNFTGDWQFLVNQPDITTQYSAPANNQINIPIPTNVDFARGGNDWNSIPPIGINIKSDSPVTIFGQNLLPDNSSGDIFTVLPVTALGTSYYIPLSNPNTTEEFGNRVIVIPTQNNTLVSFEGNTVLNIQSLYQFGASSDTVLSFTSSLPVAVIVGTKWFSLESGSRDYRALMPLPSRCGQIGDNLDTHPVMDLQGVPDEYTFAAECTGTTAFIVDNGASGQLNQNGPIHFYQFNQNTNPHVVSARDPGRYIQLIRTLPSFGGAMLAPALSVNQYVANTSLQFFSPQVVNNYVQIVADASAVASLLLDGASPPGLQWKTVPVVNGYRLNYATAMIGQGPHQFSATGTFSLTVYGYTAGSYSYSYSPAFNMGQSPMPPTTTSTLSSAATSTAAPSSPSTTAAVSSTTAAASVSSSSSFTAAGSSTTSSSSTASGSSASSSTVTTGSTGSGSSAMVTSSTSFPSSPTTTSPLSSSTTTSPTSTSATSISTSVTATSPSTSSSLTTPATTSSNSAGTSTISTATSPTMNSTPSSTATSSATTTTPTAATSSSTTLTTTTPSTTTSTATSTTTVQVQTTTVPTTTTTMPVTTTATTPIPTTTSTTMPITTTTTTTTLISTTTTTPIVATTTTPATTTTTTAPTTTTTTTTASTTTIITTTSIPITTTTPQSIDVTNATTTSNFNLNASAVRNFMLEDVNTTAGLTLAVTVTSGRFLLNASVCPSYNPSVRYLDATAGAKKVYLTTSMLQSLYDTSSSCSPLINEDGNGDDGWRDRHSINFAVMPPTITVYTTVQGGSDFDSNSGTLTVGDGDVPVDGTSESSPVKTAELSTVEIVFICLGGMALIIIVIVVIVILVRRHKKKQERSHDFTTVDVEGTVSQVIVD